jgi:hypothetical protein
VLFLGIGARPDTARTPSREFVVHPDAIKCLRTGQAAVTSPGQRTPRITTIHHPQDHR